MKSRSRKPSRRSCACMQSFYCLCDKDPNFRKRHMQIEEETNRRIATGRMAARRAVRLIPVVVHVVHRTASEKISAAQVRSQITVLNQDFRAKNPDNSKVPAIWQGLVGDTRVEFKLATKDPTGKPRAGSYIHRRPSFPLAVTTRSRASRPVV